MAKRIFYIFLLLCCLTGGWLIYENSYTRFIPTTFNTQRDKGFEDLKVDPSFYQNLPKVLVYYNIDYHIKDHVFYIKQKVASERELVWNFTTKALDREWLKSH